MFGSFTNDFLGGLCLGLACTLVGAIAGGLYALYRFPRPGTPQDPPEPDPDAWPDPFDLYEHVWLEDGILYGGGLRDRRP